MIYVRAGLFCEMTLILNFVAQRYKSSLEEIIYKLSRGLRSTDKPQNTLGGILESY